MKLNQTDMTLARMGSYIVDLEGALVECHKQNQAAKTELADLNNLIGKIETKNDNLEKHIVTLETQVDELTEQLADK